MSFLLAHFSALRSVIRTVLAEIAGRSRLLIHWKSTSRKTGVFLLCVSFETMGFGGGIGACSILEGLTSSGRIEGLWAQGVA